MYVKTDIKNYDDLKNFVDKTASSFESIDILINNAHGDPLLLKPKNRE